MPKAAVGCRTTQGPSFVAGGESYVELFWKNILQNFRSERAKRLCYL